MQTEKANNAEKSILMSIKDVNNNFNLCNITHTHDNANQLSSSDDPLIM